MSVFDFSRFWARGDSQTANNAAVNVKNTSQTPVTSLEFVKKTGTGDILLENRTGIDPDTQVSVNGGAAEDFRYQLSGTIPSDNKYSNIAGFDLRGTEVVVIEIVSTGQRYIFFTNLAGNQQPTETQMIAIMNAFPNGKLGVILSNPTTVAICFGGDTLIDTADGPRAARDIAVGDLVLTDIGPRAVVWKGLRHVGAAELGARPDLWPVAFAPDALGPGRPDRTLILSPAHRVMLEGWRVELATGEATALCPAASLVNDTTIRRILPEDGITYVHLMFETHRLVTSHGVTSESFEPGPRGLASLDAAARREVETLFGPGLLSSTGAALTPRTLKRHEAKVILGPGA